MKANIETTLISESALKSNTDCVYPKIQHFQSQEYSNENGLTSIPKILEVASLDPPPRKVAR